MPFVSCTTFNTSQAAQDAATTSAIAAATAAPAICPAVVTCITSRPTGAPAVAGDLVIGADGQKHALPTFGGTDSQALSIAGNVISLTNGGSVTLPASATVFATPAQTIAGASTTLSVNPADLVARENIPAQTGFFNDVSFIPAPTASQSPWGQNVLGETLHYAPGLGWKIVDNQYSTTIKRTSSNAVALAANTLTQVSLLIAPRAGLIVVAANVSTNSVGNLAQSGGISINGVFVSFDNPGTIGLSGANPDIYAISSNNAAAAWTGRVAAGDIIESTAITLNGTGTAYGELSLTYIGQ
jgi:hypothetical protein